MQSKRDRFLISILCVQAAVNAVNGSAALDALAGKTASSAVALVSAAISAATAAYVASTREQHRSAERPSSGDNRNV